MNIQIKIRKEDYYKDMVRKMWDQIIVPYLYDDNGNKILQRLATDDNYDNISIFNGFDKFFDFIKYYHKIDFEEEEEEEDEEGSDTNSEEMYQKNYYNNFIT